MPRRPSDWDNGALQKAIWDQMKAQPWLKAAYVNFAVKDRVVELWGAVDSDEQRRALRVRAERGAEGREQRGPVPEACRRVEGMRVNEHARPPLAVLPNRRRLGF